MRKYSSDKKKKEKVFHKISILLKRSSVNIFFRDTKGIKMNRTGINLLDFNLLDNRRKNLKTRQFLF